MLVPTSLSSALVTSRTSLAWKLSQPIPQMSPQRASGCRTGLHVPVTRSLSSVLSTVCAVQGTRYERSTVISQQLLSEVLHNWRLLSSRHKNQDVLGGVSLRTC